jgi:hypothetical protein
MTSSNEICLFQNPFAVGTHTHTHVQMEEIELQSNDSLKDAFSEGNLQFYVGLPILNFPTIKTFAKKNYNSIW